MKIVRATAGTLVALAVLVASGTATATVTDDRFRTKLKGDQVVPGPGDPDGRGTLVIDLTADTICYNERVRKIGRATAAHLHLGVVGTTGRIVVVLATPTKHGITDCITAVPDDRDDETTISVTELEVLRADPAGHYIDVHTAAHPGGAIRGQLR